MRETEEQRGTLSSQTTAEVHLVAQPVGTFKLFWLAFRVPGMTKNASPFTAPEAVSHASF
jgi:hypothetical protein